MNSGLGSRYVPVFGSPARSKYPRQSRGFYVVSRFGKPLRCFLQVRVVRPLLHQRAIRALLLNARPEIEKYGSGLKYGLFRSYIELSSHRVFWRSAVKNFEIDKSAGWTFSLQAVNEQPRKLYFREGNRVPACKWPFYFLLVFL